MNNLSLVKSMKLKNTIIKKEGKLKFSSDFVAILWITTKGASRKDEKMILDIVHKKLKKNLIFMGHCFGRHDLIVEFHEDSGKVASNTVCNLQEKLAKRLRDRLNIADPICSSLTLGNRIILQSSTRKIMNYPLKTYTFLRPKKGSINLKEIMSRIEPMMQLFWTTSSYVFLLTVNGSDFSEIFGKLLSFRKKTRSYFKESCTYVGLDFNRNDVKMQIPIRALTFLKLGRGFGGFKLKKNESEDWYPPEKRLGWSDICLTPKNKYSLRELKDAIMKIREDHRGKIITTSTLLLPSEGKS